MPQYMRCTPVDAHHWLGIEVRVVNEYFDGAVTDVERSRSLTAW